MARDGSLAFSNSNRNFYFQLFTSVSTTFKTGRHRLVGKNEEGGGELEHSLLCSP